MRLFLFMISLLALLLSLSLSAMPPVEITSDEVFTERTNEGTVTIFSGNVTVNWDGFQMRTDEVKVINEVVYLSKGTLTHLSTGTTMSFKSGSISSDGATFKDTVSVVRGVEPLKGDLYIYSEVVKVNPNGSLEMGESNVTTCSRKPPHWHYHLKAERVVVRLGDEAVLYNVRGYLGKWGLVRRGRLRISLRRDNPSDSESILPVVGYNRAEGWFAYKDFSYWINDDHYGRVRLKWAELLGTSARIEHTSRFRGGHRIYLLQQNLYGNARRGNVRDTRTNISIDTKPLRNLRLSYSMSYYALSTPTYSAPATSSTSLNLSYSLSSLLLSYSLRRSSTEGIFESESRSLRLSYSKGKLRVRYNFSDNSSTYLSTLTSRYTAKVNASLTYDTDDYLIDALWDLTRGQTVMLNKEPEIEITPKHQITLLGMPLESKLTLGKYVDPTQNMIAKRYSLHLRYTSPEWELWQLKFRFSSWFLQDFYDTGNYYYDRNWHARYVLAANLSSTYQSGPWRISARLDGLTHKGFNPLYLDSYAERELLSLNLTYQAKRWDLNLSTSLDLLRPNSNNVYYVTANWYPSKRLKVKLATSYSPRYNRWSYVSLYVDALTFSDTLRTQLWATYDPNLRKWSYVDVALVKDMHCYVIGLVYRQSSRSLFLTVSLKALPSISAGLGWNQFGPYVPGLPIFGDISGGIQL